MPKCIVPGCPAEGVNKLGLRCRVWHNDNPAKRKTTALWAPDTDAYLCDSHALGGATKKFEMHQESVMVPMGNWRHSRLKTLSKTDRQRDNSRVKSGFGKKVENWIGRELAYPTNVLYLPTECGNKGHSATFPVDLPAWFIKLFTATDEIVLDPFIGSGTTAIAATKLGRHFVGIDNNEEYLKLARKRLGMPPVENIFERKSS